MNAPLRSRDLVNPFLAPTTPTLAEVFDRLHEVPLSPTRLRDCQSALRRFSEITGEPLSAIPADAQVIRQKLEAAAPALSRLSAKTRANLRSSLLTALEAAGTSKGPRTPKIRLTPEWLALRKSISDRRLLNGTSRFARFCSANGIAPHHVNNDVLHDFGEALKASLVKNPPMLMRDTATLWNRIVEHFPERGWRPLELASRRPPPSRVDLRALPPSFQVDLDAYMQWLSGADLFAEDARIKPLAPRTRKLRLEQIKSAVTALVRSGTLRESITSLGAMTAPAAMKAILSDLYEQAGRKPNAYTSGLATTLVSIAREWVKPEPAILERIKQLRSKLPSIPSGLTEKNKALLRHFDDPSTLPRVYAVPEVIWRGLKDQRRSMLTLARAQAAVAIRILMYVPLRISNLTALEFGVNLFVPARDDEEARLEIPGSEMKNGEAYAAMLPPAVTSMLREFDQAYLRPFGTRFLVHDREEGH